MNNSGQATLMLINNFRCIAEIAQMLAAIGGFGPSDRFCPVPLGKFGDWAFLLEPGHPYTNGQWAQT
jgi:hypothetical protein